MPPLNSFSRSCLALAISHALVAPSSAAIIEVNDAGDSDPAGGCTLRQAVSSANADIAGASNCVAGSGTDTITFSNSVITTGQISVTQASEFYIDSDLTIQGPTNSTITINGMGNDRVFYLAGSTVNLNNLTITGGSAGLGGGIIAVSATVFLDNSTVTANTAVSQGGGIFIRNNAELYLYDTTVSSNTAASGGGIAAYFFVSAGLNNSTVSNNTANAAYGGIKANRNVSLSLNNSTVSGNSATFGGNANGGGVGALLNSIANINNSTVTNNSVDRDGGGLYASGSTINIRNSIISGNDAGNYGAEISNNLNSSSFTTSNNVLGDSSHTLANALYYVTPDASDITATSDGTNSTALASIIGVLADNGGPTLTHEPAALSPALDAGDGTVCTSFPIDSEDQRGLVRNSVCDIGSVEAQTMSVITVGSASDGGGNCTLRDAFYSSLYDAPLGGCAAGNNSEEIVFDTGVFPPQGHTRITLSSELPSIVSNLTITGPGSSHLTIDADEVSRVLLVEGANVTLSGLHLTGGYDSRGAGLYVSNGSEVIANDLTISGNTALSGGGGIGIRDSSLDISASSIANNFSDGSGGAIYVFDDSNLVMHDSTASGNSADLGGGILSEDNSSVNLSNSTISGNSSDSAGGGLHISTSSYLSMTNSTVANNYADGSGGAIFASTATVYLTNNILTGNTASAGAEIHNEAGNSSFTTSYNLFGDTSHTAAEGVSNFMRDASDIAAFSDGSQPTSFESILAPLANNGGTTLTHGLVRDSPAVDAADNAVCAAAPINNLDQIGSVRPEGATCDMGAFEGTVEVDSFFTVPLPNGRVIVFSL